LGIFSAGGGTDSPPTRGITTVPVVLPQQPVVLPQQPLLPQQSSQP
jgi:hypothetical protein